MGIFTLMENNWMYIVYIKSLGGKQWHCKNYLWIINHGPWSVVFELLNIVFIVNCSMYYLLVRLLVQAHMTHSHIALTCAVYQLLVLLKNKVITIFRKLLEELATLWNVISLTCVNFNQLNQVGTDIIIKGPCIMAT